MTAKRLIKYKHSLEKESKIKIDNLKTKINLIEGENQRLESDITSLGETIELKKFQVMQRYSDKEVAMKELEYVNNPPHPSKKSQN